MHDKEYLVHEEAKSYEGAVSHCVTNGGKLAEPKSDVANDDIVSLAESNIMQFRITYLRTASGSTGLVYISLKRRPGTG